MMRENSHQDRMPGKNYIDLGVIGEPESKKPPRVGRRDVLVSGVATLPFLLSWLKSTPAQSNPPETPPVRPSISEEEEATIELMRESLMKFRGDRGMVFHNQDLSRLRIGVLVIKDPEPEIFLKFFMQRINALGPPGMDELGHHSIPILPGKSFNYKDDFEIPLLKLLTTRQA